MTIFSGFMVKKPKDSLSILASAIILLLHHLVLCPECNCIPLHTLCYLEWLLALKPKSRPLD
jgi:hypothetical protein